MFLIYSLIVFNYSILKATKETLVITAPSSGAAAIPFIKVWAILPMAFFITYIFTRLSNRFTRDGVFYIMMSGFLSFFLLFSFVLYPYREFLHPNGLANYFEQHLPIGFHGLIAIFRNWTFTLYYVLSELWGTIIMTVIFWGFANQVTSVKNAKRYYAILGLGANLATIMAGQLAVTLSGNLYKIPFISSQDEWGATLSLITLVVVSGGLMTIALYRYLTHHVFKDEKGPEDSVKANKKKKPIQMGIRKNFAYLAKSKYLMAIAIIVLTYNISLNLVEVVWKHQMHLLFPKSTDFNAYMGQVISLVGITSTLVSIFLCGNVIRRWGWTVSALVTPMILLLTSAAFFAFLFFREMPVIAGITAILGTTPLAMSVFFGTLQNAMSRASKFTFFDATKEMAFIPLSDESKLKGKSAIDGVGSRLGKSGGSVVHQGLLFAFGTVSASTPYVGVILMLVIAAWIFAVRNLGHQFDGLADTPADGAAQPAAETGAETSSEPLAKPT